MSIVNGSTKSPVTLDLSSTKRNTNFLNNFLIARIVCIWLGLVFVFFSVWAQNRGSLDSIGFIHPGYFAFRHTGYASLPDSVTPISKKIVDSSSRSTPGVNYTHLALVGTGLVGGMAGIHLYQQNGWWKDNRTAFHFQEDLRYSRGVDKAGHFYGASATSFIIAKSIETANVPEEKALLIGSGAGLLFETFLEVEDGFSTWGFDRVDFAADVGGAAYPILQYYVPFFKNFEMKYSYHPVNFNKPGNASFPGQKHLISDDYEGQTLWLALKINNLLPISIEPFWPDWLGIAVGYGVRDIETPYDYPVVFLAPDLDMTKIIPRTTWFLRTLGEALNYIHLPLPAVQISPKTIWYGLYF